MCCVALCDVGEWLLFCLNVETFLGGACGWIISCRPNPPSSRKKKQKRPRKTKKDGEPPKKLEKTKKTKKPIF
jgi:hypothetical protein